MLSSQAGWVFTLLLTASKLACLPFSHTHCHKRPIFLFVLQLCAVSRPAAQLFLGSYEKYRIPGPTPSLPNQKSVSYQYFQVVLMHIKFWEALVYSVALSWDLLSWTTVPSVPVVSSNKYLPQHGHFVCILSPWPQHYLAPTPLTRGDLLWLISSLALTSLQEWSSHPRLRISATSRCQLLQSRCVLRGASFWFSVVISTLVN